ncbi:MAG: hypothetical protein JHC98_02475 [Thermoleophilaceae bacterium]|nr:hypothetical protein [Thermoleophilaceae bacterium]
MLIATLALVAVFATHGVMADDSMHEEGGSECLATASDVSPAKVCDPFVLTAGSPDPAIAFRVFEDPSDDPLPAPSGHRARHGPSDLQVFRT